MGGFSNFAISFTIISVLSGCLTLFYLIPSNGGFPVAMIGWPIVTLFVLFVALGMAELASAYPTAGGLYYWSSKLGGAGWGWFTGWFNLIGQVAVTAGIDYGLAVSIDVLLNAWIPSFPAKLATVAAIDPATQWVTLGIFGIVLAIHAFLNINGVKIVAFLNDVSVWWHIAGVVLIVGAVVIAGALGSQFTADSGFTAAGPAAGLNSLKSLFAVDPKFNATGFPLWYAVIVGLLLAQYTYTGYDASAHMSEETVGAATRAPWGVVMAVAVSAVAGYALLAGLAAARPRPRRSGQLHQPGPLHPREPPGLHHRHALLPDSGRRPVLLRHVLDHHELSDDLRLLARRRGAGLQAFGTSSTRAGLRATPSSSRRYSPSSSPSPRSSARSPISRSLRSPSSACTSPTSSRSCCASGQKASKPGPWNLGKLSRPIGIVAIAWTVFITILFMLPTASPVTLQTFNYTPVVVLGATLILVVAWVARARKTFKGPKIQGSAVGLAAIEKGVGEDDEAKDA